MTLAALAFAPHSGWASLVAVSGSKDSPVVALRGRIEMADPALPGSKQPYHEVEGWPLEKAREHLALLFASARSLALGALGDTLKKLESQGLHAECLGILESSGRKGVPLSSILASHALIHTADGEHFRGALEAAGTSLGLRLVRVPQKELPAFSRDSLQRSSEELKAAVGPLGKTLGPPWGADQKSATLLAWSLLAKGRP